MFPKFLDFDHIIITTCSIFGFEASELRCVTIRDPLTDSFPSRIIGEEEDSDPSPDVVPPSGSAVVIINTKNFKNSNNLGITTADCPFSLVRVPPNYF
jgi:hypothetical protein